MTVNPFQYFLDVPEDSPLQTLLGLVEKQTEPADVYVALYRRLIEMHGHAKGQSPEADLVRRRLRSAAKLMVSAQRSRGHNRDADKSAESSDAFRKFLHVSEFVDPLALLGVGDSHGKIESVDIALAERLRQIDSHPESGTSEAEQVRRTLLAAAALLKDQSICQSLIEMRRRPIRPDALLSSVSSRTSTSRPPAEQTGPVKHNPSRSASPPSQMKSSLRGWHASALLTPFDRQVLAVLIGCGGWNSTSRSLLVALAETYQVTPDGLVKVVKGLSDYARSHQSRLGVKEIAEGLPPDSANGQRSANPIRAKHTTAEAIDPDDQDVPLFWNPVTLSLFAAVITVIIGLTTLAIVIPGVFRDTSHRPEPGITSAIDPSPGDSSASSSPKQTTPIESRRLASFSSVPTFLGNGLPHAGAEAADASLSLPEDFDGIERRLSITDDPSEAVFHDWSFFIDQFATGWVLLDASSREASETSMMEALALAADTPSVSDRFMQALTPLGGDLPDPIDVWRGSWNTYLLGRIIESRTMAPVVVEQARMQLDLTLRNLPPEPDRTPEGLARNWLAQVSSSMIESLEYSPQAYDYWELWLSAQRELGVNSAHDLALMDAIERIMHTSVDLARPGPSVNVIGRLLSLIDWRGSDAIRERVTDMFDDSDILNQDLWVFTSLLSRHDDLAWFTVDLVMPDEADDRHRGRIRDRIRQAWPKIRSADFVGTESESDSTMLDPRFVRPWIDLATSMRAALFPSDDAGLMQLLLAASCGNESLALLLDRREEDATAALERASALWLEFEGGATNPGDSSSSGRRARASSPSIKPGQPIGPDGLWSARYAETRSNTNLRLDQLSELASTAGTDLGPLDAEVLVREVYRGVPQEIRTQAQSVLIHRFSIGPVVAMELLDQLPDAVGGQRLSDFISRLTSWVLPDVGADTWETEARLALIEHVLLLYRTDGNGIDSMTLDLMDSYSRRVEIVPGFQSGLTQPATPEESARMLVEAWRTEAIQLMTNAPVPDDLPGLHRRRMARFELAEGPIQRFVAEQVAAMELLAYSTAALLPSTKGEVGGLLARSADRRAEATRALEQAVEIELTMVALYRMRLLSMLESGRKGGDS